MPKTKLEKIDLVNKLAERFKSSKSVVLSEIKGLDVADTSELRKLLRDENVQHTVVKLTLLKRALKKAGVRTGEIDFKTQVAVTFSDDETAAARILNRFQKKNENLKMLAGYLEGQMITHEQLSTLADLPTKQDLLARFVSVLSGPARGLVTVLTGNLRGLVQVLSQINKN